MGRPRRTPCCKWVSPLAVAIVVCCLLPLFSPTCSFHLGSQPSHDYGVRTSSTKSTLILHVSDLLYEEQENMLVRRGEFENSLMADKSSPLKANKPKGVGSSGGFGGGGSGGSASSRLKAEGVSHGKVLRKEGVVRIDNVLSSVQADAMREFVMNLREQATEDVSSGRVRSLDRFADVLLKTNRCDLKIPLGPGVVNQALENVLTKSAVRHTIANLMGDDAQLYELSCLISRPGSQRQNIHPDNPCLDRPGLKANDPILLTCFIALQDVELDMGPTVWLPRTHNAKTHALFQDESTTTDDGESPKDKLLRTTPSVLGVLPKGCCAIFDSRLLHCGGSNQANMDRALFYFSFKNPKIGYPGNPGSIGYRLGEACLTLKELSEGIAPSKKSGKNPRLEELYVAVN